jgi:hydroxymethylpyrimidine/phosphomethylpyrimidine kinase
MTKTALTIAGSDPSGGAGVQADLRTFEAFGVRGLSAPTALTAQDGLRVTGVMAVPRSFLVKQVETLLNTFNVDAIKIGMLANAENALAVAGLIKKWGLEKIVLDPVLRSTDGYPLLDKKGVVVVTLKLLPLVTVVTPNIHEASVLSGFKVKDLKGMEEAAIKIASSGVEYVLIKGGHLKGAPVDVLHDGKKFYYFKGRRIKRKNLHGTGCILSSAIAAGLARGRTVKRAVGGVGGAKEYLTEVLRKKS